ERPAGRRARLGRRRGPGVDGAVAGPAPHLHHAAGDPRRRPGARRLRQEGLRVGLRRMSERPPTMTPEQAAARRRGVRRTVLVLAVVALLIYLFALNGGTLPGVAG